jgi:hypothetical protein
LSKIVCKILAFVRRERIGADIFTIRGQTATEQGPMD